MSAFAALALAAALTANAPAVSTEVEIAGPLKGTELSHPGAHEPVAVILAGSGPTDRDGNNPLGVKGSTYRLLAEALAERGVGTVRVDKRGMFGSAAGSADANRVFVTTLADDAHAWAADVKARSGAPCVWLIGHSEGTLVALIAARDAKDICGLVLISAPGRRLSDVIREQLTSNPANAPVLPQALAALDALEAGKDVDVTGMHPALLPLFNPRVQPFLKAEFAFDPAELARAYKGPILIVQGTTDLQVSVADAERLEKAHPGSVLVKLVGVNHVLKVAPADRAANIATYADPNLPLAPDIADVIAAFMKAHTPKR